MTDIQNKEQEDEQIYNIFLKAIRINCVTTVKMILEEYPKILDLIALPAIQEACRFGQKEIYELIYKIKPQEINKVTTDNKTLLHYAFAGGNLEICKSLIDNVSDSTFYYFLFGPKISLKEFKESERIEIEKIIEARNEILMAKEEKEHNEINNINAQFTADEIEYLRLFLKNNKK